MKTGLYIGRFQPFHNGHLHVIKKALGMVDELVIVIGSPAESYTSRDPLTVEERLEILRSVLGGIDGIKIIPIQDINDNKRWVKHVEGIVGEFDIVFCGHDINKALFERAGYKVDVHGRWKGISASKIRKLALSGEGWTELVPQREIGYLKRIRFEERIKSIS